MDIQPSSLLRFKKLYLISFIYTFGLVDKQAFKLQFAQIAQASLS